MHTADNVGNHRLGGVENAALNLEFFVVSRKEMFIEMNNRIFTRGAVSEISQNCRKIGFITP